MAVPHKLLFILLFLCCIALNILAVLTWHPSLVVNDGVQYLSTASSLLKGHGFSTSALIYMPHFQGVFPAAQTVWPPGYPLAVALATFPGLELPTAALILNLVSHALATTVMYLIYRRMDVDKTAAIVFSFLFYIMAMPWSFVSGLITEPVFTTLVLATLLVLPTPGNQTLSGNHSANLAFWLTCGALLAMCIYVRYSAVFFAASVGSGIFLYILIYLRPNFNSFVVLCFKLAALTVIPVLAFAHLMYRTHLLIGTLDRYSGSREPETLQETLRLWVVNSAELLGFSVSKTFDEHLNIAVFMCFSGLLILLMLQFLVLCAGTIKNSLSERALRFVRVFTLVAVLHALALFLYLTLSSMSETPLKIVNRYLYQIYCGIYILFCFMIYHLFKQINTSTSHTKKLTIGVPVAVLLALYLAAQGNELSSSRNHFFAESRTADSVMSLPVSDKQTLSEHITTFFTGDDKGTVWSTHGQHVHFYTKVNTITLADIYTAEPFQPEAFDKQISDYNMQMFLFIESPDTSKASYTQYMSELKNWLNDQNYQVVPLNRYEVDGNKLVTIYQQPGVCGV